MSAAAKILWGEGLFLRPQHFQRQDAYHEARLVQAMRLLQPHAWGLARLEVDEDGLAAGVLRVLELQAVLPDGELVNAPREDELPEPVALDAQGGVSFVFCVALAPLRPDASNYDSGDERRPAARYASHALAAADWFTGAPEAELVVLRRRPVLQPAADTGCTLPLLRLRRRAAGGFEVDRSFIAPALQIAAVPALLALRRHALDLLQAKVAALQGLQREPAQHVIEFRSGDVASFWLLQTACAAYARLSQLAPGAHPAQLFACLVELTGALLSFSHRRTLADLPAYTHERPEPAFAALDTLLRDLLETVVSTRCVSVLFEAPRPSWFVARLSPDRLGPGTAFYLGVQADLPAAALVEAVPARLKIGAPDDVERLVHSAVSGVRLTPAAQLPAAMPLRPGASYFVLEPHGALYERMLQAQTMAVYAPAGLAQLRLELHAVER
ncbi:type VI secretion system baseplate subunit TssK [Rubrivivax gelatinosus]|uniref:Type VI secretion system-associated protein n=1 Tax=Rubrivivax gelatinosus TaxID=28068 RepID=A0ABS1DZD7_RUBGE|nr:type VI secretion system baseplate subunit TssK [Rubrivivax gelatinosus]MBK1715419.1 type VI secretion system-associated protein [Rubrivivax gelatinosus]